MQLIFIYPVQEAEACIYHGAHRHLDIIQTQLIQTMSAHWGKEATAKYSCRFIVYMWQQIR